MDDSSAEHPTITGRHPRAPAHPLPKKNSNRKFKFDPPSNEIIFGYNGNDVLLGRGATSNAHVGNVNFRNICASHKPRFDVATNSEKRQIGIEIAQHVMSLDPPGRFLERIESEITIHDDGTATFEGLGEAYSNVDIQGLLGPCETKHLSEMGWGQNTTSIKDWKRTLGPWRDAGVEKAVQKVCGVIRDHKRQDRIALRAMAKLKKGSKKPSLLGYPSPLQLHPDDVNSADTDQLEDNEITPTQNDIIIGRGAFINTHSGNIQFRSFCSERKAKFDSSPPAVKRALALEVIDLVKKLDPPARFLKRDPGALKQAIPKDDGSYRLPPRGLEGPWEEVSQEKSVAKTIQVLRDLKIDKGEQQPEGIPSGHEMTSHFLLSHHVGINNYQAYDQSMHLPQLQEPDEGGIEPLPNL